MLSPPPQTQPHFRVVPQELKNTPPQLPPVLCAPVCATCTVHWSIPYLAVCNRLHFGPEGPSQPEGRQTEEVEGLGDTILSWEHCLLVPGEEGGEGRREGRGERGEEGGERREGRRGEGKTGRCCESMYWLQSQNILYNFMEHSNTPCVRIHAHAHTVVLTSQ